jgi:FAD-dependent urate hydroxylase
MRSPYRSRLTLITCFRVGAAISVWSNGIKVLNAFGLGEEVSKVGGVMESMNYRKHDTGEVLTEFSLDPLYKEVSPLPLPVGRLMPGQVNQRAFPIARTHLQRILYEKAGPSNIHLGKKAVGYTVSDKGVTLELEGGETDTGDFLIVAEGTHSKLRNKICEQTIPRRYAGYVNFNGHIPVSDLAVSHFALILSSQTRDSTLFRLHAGLNS